ncbi:unnamed protein product [Vicia faba]|uniref:Uncharacterized protein n=1 Tax=Vicia faba TaxID=3906 RepID=A0AAV0ZKC9_VICFA|nr:unnamed protein product [Vicia faba]
MLFQILYFVLQKSRTGFHSGCRCGIYGFFFTNPHNRNDIRRAGITHTQPNWTSCTPSARIRTAVPRANRQTPSTQLNNITCKTVCIRREKSVNVVPEPFAALDSSSENSFFTDLKQESSFVVVER